MAEELMIERTVSNNTPLNQLADGSDGQVQLTTTRRMFTWNDHYDQ